MGHFWDWTFFLGRAIERDLDRHAADAMGFEQPKMDCPRCGKVYEDFDGFGVV
jgi:hypothetical protein